MSDFRSDGVTMMSSRDGVGVGDHPETVRITFWA